MPGLLAEKLGMTQIFNAAGMAVPITVLRAGPCQVVTKKMPEKDGYAAIQLGYSEIDAKKRSKPYSGHFIKKNSKVFRYLKEFRSVHCDAYAPGDLLTVSHFHEGDSIDVVGQSKGKGFQGVIKRHHFAGGNASHGCSITHRHGGSIGQRTYPGKVFKGKRMAGRMGDERVTVQNLKIVGVEAGENLLLVQGAVPGANHSIVLVHPCKGDFEKRFLEGKTKAAGPKEEKA